MTSLTLDGLQILVLLGALQGAFLAIALAGKRTNMHIAPMSVR
jgi:hypothetical protein